MSTDKPGRKPGSRNKEYVHAISYPGRCPACQSTNRSPFIPGGTTTQEIEGNDPQGEPYDAVVWRKCKCLDCGQLRTERSYELRKKN